jgi:cytochrome c oxidase subunit 2
LPRLLSTDNRLILPAEKPILLSICSTDVLHAFAVPNFGLKVDAVPGRINTFWLYMNKAGIYYGQCSELCGKGHGFMPIVVDSQHYSNNPFSNEILSGQNNPEGILPTASAEAGKG